MKALYKWFAYKLPIRSKLLISFSILVMVPILVLGIYSYQQSKENTERQIRSTMESNLTRLTSELDTRFQREASTVRFLAYNLTFRNALENNGASAMTMAQVMNTSVEPTFWYFIAGDAYVKGMEVYATKSATSCCRWMIPSANRLGISRRWTAMPPTGLTMGWRFVPTVQFSIRIPAVRS